MGYGTVARMFHWLTVIIVLVMIPAGLIMTQDIAKPTKDQLYILHKGLGSLFLVVILLRLAWRAFNPPPPPEPGLSALQHRTASLTHGALYLLLLIMAVSGYVRVTTGGFPIEMLNAIGIPPLLPRMEGVSKIASSVHSVAKSVLIMLIALHVAAALYHGLIRRDGVLSRMWPPFSA